MAEDVGEGTLANGKATVPLSQGFADAANGDYRVLLTELADLGGLYVDRKGPREFEVRSPGRHQAGPRERAVRLPGGDQVGTRRRGAGCPGGTAGAAGLLTVKRHQSPRSRPRPPESFGTSEERKRR